MISFFIWLSHAGFFLRLDWARATKKSPPKPSNWSLQFFLHAMGFVGLFGSLGLTAVGQFRSHAPFLSTHLSNHLRRGGFSEFLFVGVRCVSQLV